MTNLHIDLPRLLETRLLVQANSGAGKSWAVRWLLESTADRVQQLVIDPEGEFATLREKFDFVICAPHDADALATPATAAALARTLWESGCSAILDIYDLKAHERAQFVKRFCESLISAPKRIWHPTIVVIDEAHIFAPQAAQSESAGAVIDLATRGRKRGLALIAATQRLSKLHKDVAAELLNKLVGRTGLDIDVARAADELGMTKKDAYEKLRSLEPGEFFAFGPALSRIVQAVKIGPVRTTHPKVGQRSMVAPPPASAALLAKIQKLEGLQREAEKEEATIDSLRAEIEELRRAGNFDQARAEAYLVSERQAARQWGKAEGLWAAHASLLPHVKAASEALDALVDQANTEAEAGADPLPVVMEAKPRPQAPSAERPEARAAKRGNGSAAARDSSRTASSEGLSAPQQRILDVLAELAAFGVPRAARATVAAHARVSPTSGGYFNNLGRLRSAGLIAYPNPGEIELTPAGHRAAAKVQRPPTLGELHEGWLSILPRPQAEILRRLIAAYPRAITREELARQVGVSQTSGGYFNNLGRLRTLGAIIYPDKGCARASDLLFPSRSM